jgi:hypothetical protein
MDEIVYNWNFHPLEVVYNEDTLTNVVNVVHWQLQATHVSSSILVQNIGTVGLETPDTGSFVPFEDLTKEIVTGWVETKLGEEAINNMKSSLSASIQDKLHPTRGPMTPPWEVIPTPTP